jgi:hypothetical protein
MPGGGVSGGLGISQCVCVQGGGGVYILQGLQCAGKANKRQCEINSTPPTTPGACIKLMITPIPYMQDTVQSWYAA